jgi:hypothetical protein
LTVRSSWDIDPSTALAVGQCYAYVTAVFSLAIEGDSALVNAMLPKSCLPAMNGNDLTEVAAAFIDQRPELRRKAAYDLVRRAFADKFPCE